MPLILYLLRHADALDKSNNQTDLERQLSVRGTKEAEGVGNFLKEKKIYLNRLLFSHAVRAHQTAQIIANKIELPVDKLQLNQSIYHSNMDGIIHVIRELSNVDSQVALVGHNPTISTLANALSNEAIGYFSTATIACFTFKFNEWSNIKFKAGDLTFIKSP